MRQADEIRSAVPGRVLECDRCRTRPENCGRAHAFARCLRAGRLALRPCLLGILRVVLHAHIRRELRVFTHPARTVPRSVPVVAELSACGDELRERAGICVRLRSARRGAQVFGTSTVAVCPQRAWDSRATRDATAAASPSWTSSTTDPPKPPPVSRAPNTSGSSAGELDQKIDLGHGHLEIVPLRCVRFVEEAAQPFQRPLLHRVHRIEHALVLRDDVARAAVERIRKPHHAVEVGQRRGRAAARRRAPPPRARIPRAGCGSRRGAWLCATPELMTTSSPPAGSGTCS